MSGVCLRHIPTDGSCTIREVRAEDELGLRLRELGLVPGVRLSIVGRAPLRDPVAIRIRNYTLTLRNSEADYIFVDPIEGDNPEAERG